MLANSIKMNIKSQKLKIICEKTIYINIYHILLVALTKYFEQVFGAST